MKAYLSVLVSAVALARCARTAPQELKPPSAEEVARIEAAAPSQAAAVPKRPRKVLIVNQCEGFVHSSIPYAAKAFEILGRKTGAFSATVVDDLSILERPEFDTFDAVVMNNTTLRLPLLADADEARETRAQQRFLDFVRGGKGLVGVHAATDCLYTWPAYGELLGGYFDGHPWNEEVRVKLDDPGHPLLAAFKGLDFTVADEIYQFRNYSRDSLRVLLSLDVRKTNMTKDKIKRADGDFAVAWIREYGKGRVFYFSLGHRHEIFWNAPILRCYLDGVQYALGDLPADARPSARLTRQDYEKSREAAFGPGLESMLAELASYTLGVNDSLARQVDAFVDMHLCDTPAIRETLSEGLARVAADTRATPDGRALACRKLSLVGTDNAVPALARLLDDPAFGTWARHALAGLPGQAVDAALVEALARTKGQDRLAGSSSRASSARAACARPSRRWRRWRRRTVTVRRLRPKRWDRSATQRRSSLSPSSGYRPGAWRERPSTARCLPAPIARVLRAAAPKQQRSMRCYPARRPLSMSAPRPFTAARSRQAATARLRLSSRSRAPRPSGRARARDWSGICRTKPS